MTKMTIEEIMDEIDEATAPPMPKHQAHEILAQMVEDLRSRMEALRDEMKNDEQE